MKVLTIDFDIVMAPSIGMYNNLVPQHPIEELVKENKYIALSTIDYIHYQRLTNVLLHYMTILPVEKVHFILDHEQVLNYIDNEENLTIINVDHHHDLGYKEELALNSLANREPDCADWVKYLYDCGRLKEYIWIKNPNSVEPVFEEQKRIIFNSNILQNYDDLTKEVNEIDQLVVCLSPAWIPPDIRPLFDIWVNMARTIYKVNFDVEASSFAHTEKLQRQNKAQFR